MAIVIQLGIDRADDKLFWWAESEFMWENGYISTISRPTEDEALEAVYKQAKLMRKMGKRGVFLELSQWHMLAMRLEHICKRDYGYYRDVYGWIAERMAGVGKLQVKALLDEAGIVLSLRDALGLPLPVIEWDALPTYTVRKAA